MLLGVFLHAALAYAQPAQTVWLATDRSASVLVDASIWFIHLFRMGLFFFLSGYFAKVVIERKGLGRFVWNRCLRLVIPFVLFYPFLLGAMTVVIIFALSYLEEPRGLMGMIAEAVKDSAGTQKRETLTTMHLWFVYYLVAFSALGALLYKFKPMRVDVLLRRPVELLFCPLLLVPGAMAGGTPMAAPESFVPEWWPFAFYGLFFVSGWQWRGREKGLEVLGPYVWLLLAMGGLLFLGYYTLMPVLDLKAIVERGATQGLWIRVLEAYLTAYLSVLLTIVCLLLGQRYLAGKSPLLGFIADSSYCVYLVHLPIAIFLQTLLVPLAWAWPVKLVVVVVGTLVPCLATYVVFVRYTPLGWLLHGKRAFP